MDKPNRSLIRLLAAAFVLFVSTTTMAAGRDVTRVDIDYEKFVLDNGLTVLVHSDHSTPTVYVGMWYGVGSKDEPAGKTGFAHLFEHLMFQSTENRDGEYFSPFSDAGATGMNGTTNPDRTNYYATVPSGALDMALWMESDRMSHLLGAVTQDALDEQRGVVQNEKRQGQSRPYAKMGDKIREGVYPVDHPYRHSTIGSMEDLDAASLDDVHEWFNTYYGASNVVLVLAGDVTAADAREKVSRYFGSAPSGVPLAHPKKWIPNLVENREEQMFDNVGQTRITRVWALPGQNDPDTSVMYLVNESLAGNKNSPLRRKLVDELQLATRVSGSAFGRVLSGEYQLTIDVSEGVTPDEVLAVVDETIADYLKNGPDPQIVENAKLSVNMFVLSALETGASIGRLLADGELFASDPLFVNKELEWFEAATADSLRAVAERWLTRGYYQLTVEPFPSYSSGETDVDRSTIPPVTANSTIRFPAIETTTLDNGLRVVVATRGKVPLVDVSIQIGAGTTAEVPGTPGTAAFVFGLMDKGTKKYDANELAAAKDKIAMSGTPGSGTERSTFSYRILERHLDASLDLALEILKNPTFPKEELEKEKAKVAAYLATLQHAPAGAARPIFRRAMYGADHPLGSVWSPELLDAVDLSVVRSFHKREVTPANMTIFMIGDITLSEAVAALEKGFGRWRAKGESMRRDIGTAKDAQARIILVDYPDAESSTIIAGHSVAPYDPNTSTEISVMNRAFGGGFESRLNMNLREDKGWSYGYRSALQANRSGEMTFSTSGQVQTDKTAESMQEILHEFKQFLTDRPATDNEVERIKLNRTRSLPGSYSTNRGFLSSIISSDSYGLPFDYAGSNAERIASITTDGVNARARAMLDPDQLTWVVVGDLAEIEADIRALNFGAIEIWDAFGNKVR